MRTLAMSCDSCRRRRVNLRMSSHPSRMMVPVGCQFLICIIALEDDGSFPAEKLDMSLFLSIFLVEIERCSAMFVQMSPFCR